MSKAIVVAVVLAAGQLPSARYQSDALRAMVETERAFARMSVEVNQRAAFLAFFAPEGVSFSPVPVNTREAFGKRPVPERPRARVLDWEPAVASVAVSGDLGYSTGPFAATDEEAGGKRLSEGWFFSVWKRLPDGTWRVVADLGAEVPGVGALRPRTLQVVQPALVTPPVGCSDAPDVLAAERTLAELAERDGVVSALTACSTADTRVYRRGMAPLVGKSAIVEGLEAGARLRPKGWRPGATGVSSAGDLAYVYGTCEVTSGVGATASTGSGGYLRVWRRTGGRWLLEADLLAHR